MYPYEITVLKCDDHLPDLHLHACIRLHRSKLKKLAMRQYVFAYIAKRNRQRRHCLFKFADLSTRIRFQNEIDNIGTVVVVEFFQPNTNFFFREYCGGPTILEDLDEILAVLVGRRG